MAFDTRPHPPGSIVLEFTRDSFLNSTLVDHKLGDEVYAIRSSAGLPINGMRIVLLATDAGRTEELAVVIKGAFFKSDKISFRGEEPIKVKDWLKDDTFIHPQALNSGVTASQYTWRRLPETVKDIALYKDDSPDPVAWYRPSVRAETTWPATLAILPDAFAMQDIILASLLVVVQVARVRDSQGTSLAHATPAMLLGSISGVTGVS